MCVCDRERAAESEEVREGEKVNWEKRNTAMHGIRGTGNVMYRERRSSGKCVCVREREREREREKEKDRNPK